MTSILHRIVEQKKKEVAQAKKNAPLNADLQQKPLLVRDFIGALKSQTKPAIIAEIKKASPSKGVIREQFDVAEIATLYAHYGARCLSVLTDEVFFQGQPEYLALAKNQCTLPVLRKDFIIDAYQIQESLFLGADCILLIAAILDDVQLMDFCHMAKELHLAVLVESHNRQELDRALRLPTPLMGINNRDLHQFHTDLQISMNLSALIPKDKIIISESGINTHHDILQLQAYGINTFLVGEQLMRATDIGAALTQLMGEE
jgi:indole-3-glycerol phosphate synthase